MKPLLALSTLLCAGALLMGPPSSMDGGPQAPYYKWKTLNSFATMKECNPDYPAERKAQFGSVTYPGYVSFSWVTECVCADDPRLTAPRAAAE